MFGVDAGSGTTLEKFANTLRAIPTGRRTSRPSSSRSPSSSLIVGLGAVNKKIPGALIAVVGTIVAELRRSTLPPTA